MEDEHDLASRAAAGDVAAFATLVRRLEPRVRRFLRRTAGHAADDIAQEAFLRAWQRRGTWRGEASYAGWVLRIAWSTFLDAERSAQRRLRREGAAELLLPPPSDVELGTAVAQALATLTPRERAVAELSFVQGFSHSEAATILGLPLGTAKTLVSRARARLVHLLEEPL